MDMVKLRQSERANMAAAAGGGGGWLTFAGVLLALVGAFQVIAGLTALLNDEFFVVGKDGLVVELDYTAWGWVHLGIGVFLLLAAGSVFAGHMFGRVVATIVASLSAIANLLFISAYPAWSLLMITLDVLVIYAVVVHGGEAEAA
jgi:hypothetical protein